jgi:hypothetical protein
MSFFSLHDIFQGVILRLCGSQLQVLQRVDYNVRDIASEKGIDFNLEKPAIGQGLTVLSATVESFRYIIILFVLCLE